MSKDINTLLKEATKDLLTEETLNAITEAIETKTDDKARLAVEAALVKQDQEYADKLKTVLESIDADHSSKLDKIVSRLDETHAVKFKHALDVLDEDHVAKLNKIVKLYENAIHQDAVAYKNTLVEQISNFIDLYLDEAIPSEQIAEATQNARSRKIINEVKRLIGLSDEFVNEGIKEALIDGKTQIEESARENAELQKQLKLVTEKNEDLEKTLYLEHKVVNFPASKKEYMLRVLSEKKLSDVKANFKYVSEMYDKSEEEDLETLRETSIPKTDGVDIVGEEEVINEGSHSRSTADDDGSSSVVESYLPAFTKRIRK